MKNPFSFLKQLYNRKKTISRAEQKKIKKIFKKNNEHPLDFSDETVHN